MYMCLGDGNETMNDRERMHLHALIHSITKANTVTVKALKFTVSIMWNIYTA
jgi:hypothetical protein